LGGLDRLRPPYNHEVNLETDELGCKVRKSFDLAFCPSVLNGDIPALQPAMLVQPAPKGLEVRGHTGRRWRHQDPYPGLVYRLLRGGHPWCSEHAEGQEDEESDSAVLHGSLLLC
jgi:hypothetical protein